MSELICTLWPPSGPEPRPGTEIVLDAAESRHLVKARRVRAGAQVWAAVGDGRGVRCVLEEDDREAARLRAEEVVPQWREPRLRVSLALGLVRPRHMETALTEGTSLGIHRFIPLLTERVEHQRWRPERWDRLRSEAVKQCARGWFPPVEEPHTLPDLLDAFIGMRLLVGSEEAPRTLREIAYEDGLDEHREVLVVIGPEGDITPGERTMLEEGGASSFRLGGRRLRSETAALAALGLLLAD